MGKWRRILEWIVFDGCFWTQQTWLPLKKILRDDLKSYSASWLNKIWRLLGNEWPKMLEAVITSIYILNIDETLTMAETFR